MSNIVLFAIYFVVIALLMFCSYKIGFYRGFAKGLDGKTVLESLKAIGELLFKPSPFHMPLQTVAQKKPTPKKTGARK